MSQSVLLHAAEQSFARLAQFTADYKFSTSGLKPDPDIVAAVEAAQKAMPAEIDDEAYLALIRSGEGRYTAARKLGIPGVAIRRRLRFDVEFREQVEVNEAESLEPIVDRMRELAGLGEKWAAIKLLESKNNAEYGEQEKKVKFTVDSRTTISTAQDPIDRRIQELQLDLIEQAEARGLPTGILDIPVEDTEEIY